MMKLKRERKVKQYKRNSLPSLVLSIWYSLRSSDMKASFEELIRLDLGCACLCWDYLDFSLMCQAKHTMGRTNNRQVVLGYGRKSAKPGSVNELASETAIQQAALLHGFCLQDPVLSSCPSFSQWWIVTPKYRSVKPSFSQLAFD